MARLESHYAGRHVMITGGSMGIGLATARRLVGLGAGVTLVARGEERLAAAADELQRRRPDVTVRTLALDVSDEAAVADAVPREVAQRPVDFLVNGAGIARPREFAATEPGDLREHMDVIYWGAVWMTRAVVPGWLERGSGHLVNIGSTASVIGVYGYAGYTPPKFALYGLSEVLRAELAPRGIRVTIVMPSNTDTAMLASELETAPPQTKKILESQRTLSPDRVAEVLLRGVARGKFEVIPGLDIRLSARAYRLAPRVGRAVLDFEARRGGRSARGG
jgi:3-dehydrosphinganine reductase